MIEIQNKTDCMGCGACVNACPKHCITLTADPEGFWYPSVDAQQCVQCNACVKACPIQTNLEWKTGVVQTYAAISKNEAQRMESSSGGIFALLAEAVLEQGGVVFGAAFTEDFKAVYHIAVQSREELWRLQGSKYFQSSIGQSYSQVKTFLKQGRTVLFTGTPCQIGGLYSYLGRDDDRLFTQSVVCHGVASPLIWEQYAQSRENAAEQKLTGVSFREKRPSWRMYSMRMDFAQGKQLLIPAAEDPYLKCYIKNYMLRPSCYNCRFKSNSDRSDLTLGDFWGIRHIHPEMNDEKGTSLVLVRTEKGRQLLEQCSQRMNIQAADYDRAVFENPAVVRSVKVPAGRKRFMNDIRKESVHKVLLRYGHDTAATKVMTRLRWYRAKLMRKLKK